MTPNNAVGHEFRKVTVNASMICAQLKAVQCKISQLHLFFKVDLVARVNPDTLIHILRSELKNCNAPGLDKIYNDILNKAMVTYLYT